jgi:fused signal recognition particle receptor
MAKIQTLFGSLDDLEQQKTEQEARKGSLFGRMREAVTRTRENLSERMEDLVGTAKEIDQYTLDELEGILISADLGSQTASELIDSLKQRATRKQVQNTSEIWRIVKEDLLTILNAANNRPAKQVDGPEVILVVGVNGTGKTTTLGKLAYLLKSQGKGVLLAAGDTFRAAAIEQLEIWAQRNNVEMIKTKAGGDPAAVLFDAMNAAKARNADYLLVDTAGRLHNKAGLMAELEKMKRTAQRFIPDAPHEVLLVMDATTGQNGLQQAKIFTESAGVTGIVLTKLDGTAKGGIVVAISRELGLPVRYVGVGEKIGDLIPFDAQAFVDSIFPESV